ncbi:unnamed protein product [Adineta steineri]|uniref:Methyltransferase FkbM domain-containing protein n=1 Tax=Adineta steineri TaxID=433720 RepID=A0A819KW05_9BILA|nr:unnamed protein product [Adineta steineri]
MKEYKRFLLYGLVVGTVIGFYLIFNLKSFVSYENIFIDKTDFMLSSRLIIYNKTCGLQHWKEKKNFGHRDDIPFFSILSTILSSTEKKIIIIEFGANVGQFSERVLSIPHKIPYIVHSIEPVLTLFHLLRNRSRTFKKEKNDKHFHYNLAISDQSGEKPIYSPSQYGEGSTLGKAFLSNFKEIENVTVTTLPEFIKKYHIKTPISFIKIDVEGFEPEVIRGMNLSINAKIFPLFSFETGETWLDDRSVLAKEYTLKSFVEMLNYFQYDSYFIGNPYLLPISGTYWKNSFDGLRRNPNVLAILRHSQPWKNLKKLLNRIPFTSC